MYFLSIKKLQKVRCEKDCPLSVDLIREVFMEEVVTMMEDTLPLS